MRAIIIDDERLARVELRRLLAGHPEIEIVAEAVDARDGAERIESLRPDLIFLDIQMPGGSGFDMLAGLEHVPRVIFTTAFDEYALRAFEVNALDYLLKPIDPRRLAASIARLVDQPPTASAGEMPRMERIFIRDGDRCWFVTIADVILMESEGNYTRLFFDKQRPLLLRSLSYLEARLDPAIFFRASRKHIVNLRAIESLQPSLGGGLSVRLTGNITVEMSRRQALKFRDMTSI
jgi:two-component system LytT family response regulator